MTLVKLLSASEIAVKSGATQGMWIDGYGVDWWIAASWILVGIVTWLYPDEFGSPTEKNLEELLICFRQ